MNDRRAVGPATLGDGHVIRHDRAAGGLAPADFPTGGPLAERSLATPPAGTLQNSRTDSWEGHPGGTSTTASPLPAGRR
ncbi:hypothetical protein ACFV1A_06130 [Streptomyces seoulensis]|uniref:hypothetical protein n=1 Tax=Streptomyces seoulensis TaxID=73044 RepID=UPI0036C05D48